MSGKLLEQRLLHHTPAISAFTGALPPGEIAFDVVADGPDSATHQKDSAEQLQGVTEQKLKWGESVNGLRMALAWPPSLGDPAIGNAPEFQLVVQNVSDTPVRLVASADAPNPRTVLMREGSRVLQGIGDNEPTPGDWLLRPREVALLPVYSGEFRMEKDETTSSLIEAVIRSEPRFSLTAQMTIEKALAGAWTGKLKTGETRGSMDVVPSKNEDAQALYKSWTTAARANGDIPGALIGQLADSVKTFIKYNPTWEKTPRLEKLLPIFDATRDWLGQDAVALLDLLAAVQDSPIKAALELENNSIIRKGAPLPPELADVPWGKAQPNGLRHAWLLEPLAAEHRLGTPLNARVLIHNSEREPVVFRTRTWHQLKHQATDANGAEIKTESTSWTTRGLLLTYRLAPGEFIEVSGPGIGVGQKGNPEDWQSTRVGTWVEANAGDEVTVTTAPLPLSDWSDESAEDVGVGVSPWWLDHIRARLSRHLPFPADKDARLRLLHRVAIEVLGTSVSKRINDSFVADMTPAAIDSLAERLTGSPGLKTFLGQLPSAPTRFRVVPADPPGANPAIGKPVDGNSSPQLAWGREKDGFSCAMRIIGELSADGDAAAELWVRNSGGSTVSFSWSDRPDIGLAIKTTDGSVPPREAHMTKGKRDFSLKYLRLPAGQVVKLKDFTIRLGTPPTDGPVGIVSLPLPPGDWTLVAEWFDTKFMIESVPEWRGVLTTAELKLKVTPEGATVATAEAVKGSAGPAASQAPKPEKAQDGADAGRPLREKLDEISKKIATLREERKRLLEPLNASHSDSDAIDEKIQAYERAFQAAVEVGSKRSASGVSASEQPTEITSAKISPEFLLGFWKGNQNGEAINISFHRPPADTDVQCDLYLGKATIGAPMSFTIAPDQRSVRLLLWKGRGKAAVYGRLTPGEGGTLQLELAGQQATLGKPVLTRKAKEQSDVPRQKQPRALLALWQKSAFADGKLPGALIGKFAEAVKSYVNANPNLDSAAKLPRLLPRFDASRDWTPAEAVSLLDDVAYYSTAPIEAVLAEPSDALWKSKVRFEQFAVDIADWSAEKDGLRIGLRVVEGEWSIGGKVRIEMWLHNASAKDVSFSANPGRADVGLSVAAMDSEGEDHWSVNGNVLLIAIPHHCVLSAGFVAKVKDFELSFDAHGNKELAWMQPKFRDLKPGKYKLRCTWADANPVVSNPGDWTGNLTTPDVEFTLGGQGASAPKPAANSVRFPDEVYAMDGFPLEDLNGQGVMWSGDENGLSLGYRVTGLEWRILGNELKVELWVLNSGRKDVKFQILRRADEGLRVKLTGKNGKTHVATIVPNDVLLFGMKHHLSPGQCIKVNDFPVRIVPPEGKAHDSNVLHFAVPPGWYQLVCEVEVPGFTATRGDGRQTVPGAGEWTGVLTTRSLNVDVVPLDLPPPKSRVEWANVDIKKDGRITFDRMQVTLDELSENASQNKAKRFDIEADANVPYADVIEVVEALKAAGVTDFSFSQAQLGDGKYRVANRTGSYEFDEKHKFSICQPLANSIAAAFALPNEVETEFLRLGFVIGRAVKVTNEPNTSLREVLAAESAEEKSK